MFGKEAEKRKRYFLNLIAQTLLLIREVVNRFWAQKESVMSQYYRAFSDKATPNKWLQSEPATLASFFGSGACRLNHALYWFCGN